MIPRTVAPRQRLRKKRLQASLLTGSTPDTIDLQSQDSPSAKDHSRQPAHPAPLGDGPPAPHQANTLKLAEQEATDLHLRSPRVSQDLSGKELQLLQNEGDSFDTNDADGLMHDTYGLQRNGIAGSGGLEGDGGEGDGDDGLEDDMMDKISSSPSIEDGGYPSTLPWPNRGDSLVSFHTPPEDETSAPPEHVVSSSPFLSPPAHYPLLRRSAEHLVQWSEDHHHTGEYTRVPGHHTTAGSDIHMEHRDRLGRFVSERHPGPYCEEIDELENSCEDEFDTEEFRHLLLPSDDPLLDNDFDDASLSPGFLESKSSNIYPSEQIPVSDDSRSFHDDDDDTEDVSFSPASRFVDSGWGGECLREAEDIDFEFVYALHTFVATVEGQANATKGDTMVLLDDSNSYWWLVRVVKDSSIGYLPAEHIETPTERLARLNKHRNIDLSQTMLGDNPERSKNPLKKAMRRRNAKTVQFAAPTYVEASDVEYSTEEEEEGDGDFYAQDEDGAETQDQEQEAVVDEGAPIEPLNTRGPAIDPHTVIDPRVDAPRPSTAIDEAQSTDDDLERIDNDASAKSRKGTVRNTDSFFKDDSVETRKINLTPSLLRDDSSNSTIRSVETREPLKTRPSLDSLEKVASPPTKSKEDKSRKEKKGMLSGLFKRKDRKGKGQDDDADEGEKISEELTRASPQPKDSSESLPLESPGAKSAPQSRPHRQTSKLQKAPPHGNASGIRSPPSGRRDVVSPKPTPAEHSQQRKTATSPTGPPPSVGQIKIPKVFEEPSRTSSDDVSKPQDPSPEQTPKEEEQIESPKEPKRSMFSPIKDVLLSSSPVSSESKPEKVRKAKHRMLMDEFDSDSSPDAKNRDDPLLERPGQVLEQEREGLHDIPDEAFKEHLSESPVQVPAQSSPYPSLSPYSEQRSHDRTYIAQEPNYLQQTSQERHLTSQQLGNSRQSPQDRSLAPEGHPETQHSPTRPPGLVIDTSSQEEPSMSPVSPISSPELIDPPTENSLREETPASTAQSSNVLPAWNGASLRAYLENDNEIRDLLLVVHDKSNIRPAPPEHPVAKNLFKEENQRLGEMSNQLDAMLGNLLERRSKSRRR